MTVGVWASRRWQIAWWGNLLIGGLLFCVCAADLSWLKFYAAFAVAWICGFGAAVLVEIATG